MVQAGLSPVFVCTFGAGGVGLTLTAAATVILLDRPWTPGETLQAEDRVRRIGQSKEVKSLWMSAFEMDKQIDYMLESKKQTSSAVLAQGHATSAGGMSAKISIPQLLASLLSKSATFEPGSH
jgi:SNF2 family DNA or RNA helicase